MVAVGGCESIQEFHIQHEAVKIEKKMSCVYKH